MVICLEQGADLHTAQLMPLPLTVSCFSKIQIGLPFWYRISRVVPDKRLLNGCVCVCVCVRSTVNAFSAVTLLVRHREEHQTCKNWVMRCWCGYLSGVRCRLFAYDPADATAIPKPHHLLPRLNTLVLPFWYQITQGVLEKRLLNGCSSSK